MVIHVSLQCLFALTYCVSPRQIASLSIFKHSEVSIDLALSMHCRILLRLILSGVQWWFICMLVTFTSFPATGIKHAFVVIQISRFQQIIAVYTFQAHSEAAKVSANQARRYLSTKPNEYWITNQGGYDPNLVDYWLCNLIACCHLTGSKLHFENHLLWSIAYFYCFKFKVILILLIDINCCYLTDIRTVWLM